MNSSLFLISSFILVQTMQIIWSFFHYLLLYDPLLQLAEHESNLLLTCIWSFLIWAANQSQRLIFELKLLVINFYPSFLSHLVYNVSLLIFCKFAVQNWLSSFLFCDRLTTLIYFTASHSPPSLYLYKQQLKAFE